VRAGEGKGEESWLPSWESGYASVSSYFATPVHPVISPHFLAFIIAPTERFAIDVSNMQMVAWCIG